MGILVYYYICLKRPCAYYVCRCQSHSSIRMYGRRKEHRTSAHTVDIVPLRWMQVTNLFNTQNENQISSKLKHKCTKMLSYRLMQFQSLWVMVLMHTCTASTLLESLCFSDGARVPMMSALQIGTRKCTTRECEGERESGGSDYGPQWRCHEGAQMPIARFRTRRQHISGRWRRGPSWLPRAACQSSESTSR